MQSNFIENLLLPAQRLLDGVTQHSQSETAERDLISEYRRLKSIHNHDNTQIFPNSRRLPIAKTSRQEEILAKDYWSHVRTGMRFDCCRLHKSKKELLMQQVLAGVSENQPLNDLTFAPELRPTADSLVSRAKLSVVRDLTDNPFSSDDSLTGYSSDIERSFEANDTVSLGVRSRNRKLSSLHWQEIRKAG